MQESTRGKIKETIISDTNKTRIDKIITESEGRSTARTIRYEDLVRACSQIEKHLDIPKTYLEGVSYEVDIHARKFPRAYNATPYSTHAIILFKNGKWRLTNVYRHYTWRKKYQMTAMPDRTKEKIMDGKYWF